MRKFTPSDSTAEEPSLYADRTVEGEFEKNKSLEAVAFRQNKKRDREERRERQRALEEFHLTQEASTAELQRFYDLQQRGAQQLKAGANKVLKKRITGWTIVIAAKICFWQFVFALLSLIGFLMQAAVLTWKSESFIGKVVGFFIDFDKFFPGQYIGYGFWGIALFVGLGGFIAFMLFFSLTGVKMVNSILSYFILALCIAATILPFSNLFPSLLIWVLYLNRPKLSSKS